MKRYIVWGHSDRQGLSFRLTQTDSRLWAYAVAYWHYFDYVLVEVFDRKYYSGVLLR